ncbi:hypothetical protein KCU65_g9786, partial [Aureobasidium melanogenum]
MWHESCALDVPCDENKISLPACLSIATACSALKNIRLDREDDIPSDESNMRATRRIAAAKGFHQLPRTIQDMTLCCSSLAWFKLDEFRRPNASPEQDPSRAALQEFSMQLQNLHLESLEVFAELFCSNGLGLPIEAYWPYLETLQLKDQVSPFGGMKLVYPVGLIREQYLDRLYTSLGHAAQKTPSLKSIVITHSSLDYELELSIKNERWNLTLCVMDKYQPSPEFLKAWKVPGGSLKPCINKYWRQGTYASWPPS